jgi:hypothetical protein
MCSPLVSSGAYVVVHNVLIPVIFSVFVLVMEFFFILIMH